MKTIFEDYVDFQTAKLLKEKGFDEVCQRFYDIDYPGEILGSDGLDFRNSELVDAITAPTHQMALKHLRNSYNRFIEVCADKAHNFKDIVFRPAIYDKELNCLWESDNFPTYEEATEAAIKYCLENLI